MNLQRIIPTSLALPQLKAKIEIASLVLDSRQVKPGDCFVALKGLAHDGRDFMAQALEQGAVAILYEPDELTATQSSYIASHPSATLLPCPGLAQHLPMMAARLYGEPSEHMHVVAVTGTNGKSSIVHGITQLYGAFHEPCMMMGTLGIGPLDQLEPNPLTTPDCIAVQRHLEAWRTRGVETAAMEASSHALEQGRLSAVNIRTAIFTNLTRDHLDYHGTLEAYGEAKALLYGFPSVEQVIFNLDDPWCYIQLTQVEPSKLCIGYSLQGKTHPRCSRVLQGRRDHSTLHMIWGDTQVSTDLPLLGDFNFSNALAMVAALLMDGFILHEIAEHMNKLNAIPGRMQKAMRVSEPCVIIDYAHTPDALEKVIQTLRAEAKGRVICVFGCGGDRDPGKRPMMGAVVSRLADYFIITNDNPRSEQPLDIVRAIEAGIQQPAHYEIELDRVTAINKAIHMAAVGDMVLIAGKGHEKTQIIGDQKIHHDDVQVATSVLREMQHEAQ